MAPAKSQPERELQTAVLDYLNRQPDFFAWRAPSTGVYDSARGAWLKKTGFDIKGVSDVLAIHAPRGRIVAWELKAPGVGEAGVSTEQWAFIRKVRRMGGFADWADSLEKVILATDMIRKGEA